MAGLYATSQKIGQANLQAQAELERYQNPVAAVVGATGLVGGGATSVPNIPMSDSYNASASSPVFPPAAQDQAAAVFGSNDERQGSTSGFKDEIKERIIGDLNSL
jgi:hypothetical protein|tara:strand:+ start:115 stop:429 length:315 start_codon:yes stop_codon:yes gene_type:complete